MKRILVVVPVLAAAALSACAVPGHRIILPPLSPACAPAPARDRLRVVSFNIRSGLSSSIGQIADVLAGMDADVIALQEVDVGCKRTGTVNQAQAIASRLGYHYAFVAAMERDGGDYGVALLSRLPFEKVERVDLLTTGAYEPRAAIDATLCAGAVPVRVVTVHADVLPWSAAANARELAEQLEKPGGLPVHLIVAGDFNSGPRDAGPQVFDHLGLRDLIGLRAEGPTFHFAGERRLDYIFADATLADDGATAGRTSSEVSDHWPVHAELAWPAN